MPYGTHPMELMMHQQPAGHSGHLQASHHLSTTTSLPPPPPSIPLHNHRSPIQQSDLSQHSMDNNLQSTVPVTREYTEYFEFGSTDRYHGTTPVPPVVTKPSVNYDTQLSYKNYVYSSDTRAKLNSPSSDCMYSDSSVMDTSSLMPSTSPSFVKAEPASLVTTTTAIPSILSPSLSSVTPMCESTFTSHGSLDEFDITHPSDILSLDQPIRTSQQSNPANRGARRMSSCSNPDLRSSLDLTSLFGLPGINSFLDEEEQQQQQQQQQQHIQQQEKTNEQRSNEHVDKILGLSLNYGSPNTSKDSNSEYQPKVSPKDQKVPSPGSTGSSPPLLAELQPLTASKHGNTGMMTSRRFNESYTVKPANYIDTSSSSPPLASGAFQPYISPPSESRAMTYSPVSTSIGFMSSTSKSYYPSDSYNNYYPDMYNYHTGGATITPQQSSNTFRNHQHSRHNINITLNM